MDQMLELRMCGAWTRLLQRWGERGPQPPWALAVRGAANWAVAAAVAVERMVGFG